MADSTPVERRKSARYDARLNLNVHVRIPGEDDRLEDLETINVSSSGLYFRSSAFMEPMTKLALSFDVPVDASDHDKIERVECEGIVVRVAPEDPEQNEDGFDVAVFFTTIDVDSLRNLELYLEAVLTF